MPITSAPMGPVTVREALTIECGGRVALAFHGDGSVTSDPSLKPDEAARAVIEALLPFYREAAAQERARSPLHEITIGEDGSQRARTMPLAGPWGRRPGGWWREGKINESTERIANVITQRDRFVVEVMSPSGVALSPVILSRTPDPECGDADIDDAKEIADVLLAGAGWQVTP